MARLAAGIGFTVSLFITNLAFDDAAPVDEATIGILAGSAVIGALGLVAIRLTAGNPASE